MRYTRKDFNQLTASEAERLALLAEECGEVIRAIGKILRHGYESRNPDRPGLPNNRVALQNELGDVYFCMTEMARVYDVNMEDVVSASFIKERKVKKYLHHQ